MAGEFVARVVARDEIEKCDIDALAFAAINCELTEKANIVMTAPEQTRLRRALDLCAVLLTAVSATQLALDVPIKETSECVDG